MKTKKTFGRIISTAPKSVSYYGNPSRFVTFETTAGEVLTGYTANNADCGYGCDNSNLKEFAIIEYHYTNGGSIVITEISGKPSESTIKAFRERTNHRICTNAKRNRLLNDLFSDIIDKMTNYDEDDELLEDLRRYKANFPNEIDYNYAQYGNLSIYFDDVREQFEKFGYNTKRINNDTIWKMYLYAVREVIEFILDKEIYLV